jgi:TrmH family RNA methyltransferase
VERIISRQNPLVARFRDVARGRGPESRVLLDGPHLVSAALDAGRPLEVVAVRASAPADGDEELVGLLARLEGSGVPVVAATSAVLAAMSPARTPSGIVALAVEPPPDPERLLLPPPALVVVAVQVQDPGNVGAIIRAADAAGATGVVVTEGSADPFGWKALRGSMGSALRLPVWSHATLEGAARLARGGGLRLVAAAPRGGVSMDAIDLTGPTALLLGSEGEGLDARARAFADVHVRIPMREGVESLNVAVTAALLAYEARRQRRLRSHD